MTMTNREVEDALAWLRSTAAAPSSRDMDVIRWYIRNAGATGRGPFADVQPRKVIAVVNHKWTMLPGFSTSDIEG